ncbi:hypothetical protein [Paraherbaspirillum soli]|uniref:Molybdenum ABC transporter permease n=1 Tax=Paraherbaspirillum soli TaxID=631222 RepID=A0ABW0MAJ2_9BURK
MIKAIGIIMFLLGSYGQYWVGKRSFHRRNQAGIEVFESYGGALATQALEKVVKIASGVGIALGFILFCVGYGFGH